MTSLETTHKYRIVQLIRTYGDEKSGKMIMSNLMAELQLSHSALNDKLFARQGQNGIRHSFSLREMQVILQVLNRYRPFRRQLVLEQLYHPDVKIGR